MFRNADKWYAKIGQDSDFCVEKSFFFALLQNLILVHGKGAQVIEQI